jgi:antitoxin VapB
VIDIIGIYQEVRMAEKAIARLFMHGRSQAVRLPLAFRMPGDRVRVRRVKEGILLEPIITDIDAWLAEIDRLGGGSFPDAPEDLPLPDAEDLFE